MVAAGSLVAAAVRARVAPRVAAGSLVAAGRAGVAAARRRWTTARAGVRRGEGEEKLSVL